MDTSGIGVTTSNWSRRRQKPTLEDENTERTAGTAAVTCHAGLPFLRIPRRFRLPDPRRTEQ